MVSVHCLIELYLLMSLSFKTKYIFLCFDATHISLFCSFTFLLYLSSVVLFGQHRKIITFFSKIDISYEQKAHCSYFSEFDPYHSYANSTLHRKQLSTHLIFNPISHGMHWTLNLTKFFDSV